MARKPSNPGIIRDIETQFDEAVKNGIMPEKGECHRTESITGLGAKRTQVRFQFCNWARIPIRDGCAIQSSGVKYQSHHPAGFGEVTNGKD